MSGVITSPYTAWLRERVDRAKADGRTLAMIARVAGVDYQALRNPLVGKTSRPSYEATRRIAIRFGDDPDEIAALAGYPNLRAVLPPTDQFTAIEDWLCAVLEARNEPPRHASEAAGLAQGVCGQILAGHPPERKTVALLAAYFGVPADPLFALAGHRSQEENDADPLVRALEEKRIRERLKHEDVFESIGITSAAYWRLIRGETRLKLKFTTLAGVFRFLEDVSAEQVLEWAGYTSRLSPVGKLIAPVLLARGWSQKMAATKLGIDEETLLWGKKRRRPAPAPRRRRRPGPPGAIRQRRRRRTERIELLARELSLDLTELQRAHREVLELKPPRPNPFKKQIRRRGGRKVLAELRKRGRLLGKGYQNGYWKKKDGTIRTITPKQRRERSKTANDALKERHKTATEQDRVRFRLAHEHHATLKGRVGLCWLCETMTYRNPSVKPDVEPEAYHPKCLGAWQARSSEWQIWANGARTTPEPRPAHRSGRRLNSQELVELWRIGVLYIRVRSGQPARFSKNRVVRTVGALAAELTPGKSPKRATDNLLDSVKRLVELLPDPAVCNHTTFAARVIRLRDGLSSVSTVESAGLFVPDAALG